MKEMKCKTILMKWKWHFVHCSDYTEDGVVNRKLDYCPMIKDKYDDTNSNNFHRSETKM